MALLWAVCPVGLGLSSEDQGQGLLRFPVHTQLKSLRVYIVILEVGMGRENVPKISRTVTGPSIDTVLFLPSAFFLPVKVFPWTRRSVIPPTGGFHL